jgi:hypothetical protein
VKFKAVQGKNAGNFREHSVSPGYAVSQMQVRSWPPLRRMLPMPAEWMGFDPFPDGKSNETG